MRCIQQFKERTFGGLKIKVGDNIVYNNKLYRVLEISGNIDMTYFKLEDNEIINSNIEILEATILALLFNEDVEEKIKIGV